MVYHWEIYHNTISIIGKDIDNENEEIESSSSSEGDADEDEEEELKDESDEHQAIHSFDKHKSSLKKSHGHNKDPNGLNSAYKIFRWWLIDNVSFVAPERNDAISIG